ncbi:NAD-dependent histone deacetylase Sir2 [Porphyridium purpureum]|uniref:NAD-dependent histone deacetylase Sir2 n=1 Tax=Porphyridium purpureum TaxID=35688 RepID=A0A5J4YWE5_PORPP|nr:NAD-dependent histone deacetylase Sir2 [Porphyridium purpureum]|eukprot:POR2296..scf209_3
MATASMTGKRRKVEVSALRTAACDEEAQLSGAAVVGVRDAVGVQAEGSCVDENESDLEQTQEQEGDEETDDSTDDSTSSSSHSSLSVLTQHSDYQRNLSAMGEGLMRGDDMQTVIDCVIGRPGVLSLDYDDVPHLSELARLVTYIKRPKLLRHRLYEQAVLEADRGLEFIANLLATKKNIVVLAGAGVSVSCGIPDFRSPGGLYEQVEQRFGLPDPQALFDINYFMRDPFPFFSFAQEILPDANIQPSLTHLLLRGLERANKLRRLYTQNIDGLESRAGIERYVPCHGSFRTVSCIKCGSKSGGDSIRSQVARQQIPLCPVCVPEASEKSKDPEYIRSLLYAAKHLSGVNSGSGSGSGSDSDSSSSSGTRTDSASESPRARLSASNARPPILKYDVVFFGEPLGDEFHENIEEDLMSCDLLIVIGTSCNVAPVAKIPLAISPSVPQILINREQILHRPEFFDIELLGNCDDISRALLHSCPWLADEARMQLSIPQDILESPPPHYEFVAPNRFVFEARDKQ